MQISFINKPCRCSNCHKEYEQVYALFEKNFCRDCLTGLAKLIFITVGHFDKLGNNKEDKILIQLEKALEVAKSMTSEEYLELLERCKGMKDVAYEEMVLLNSTEQEE